MTTSNGEVPSRQLAIVPDLTERGLPAARSESTPRRSHTTAARADRMSAAHQSAPALAELADPEPTQPAAPRQLALAGLLRCAEPPAHPAVRDYIEQVGPEDAWQSICRRAAPAAVLRAAHSRIGDRCEQELHARAAEDLRIAAACGARIIGPGDPDWPAEALQPLQWTPPYARATTAAAPLALYVRGALPDAEQLRAVAVVGSRAATPYGVRCATDLAARAVSDGVTVVSGAAFGIDAAAHRGALQRAQDGLHHDTSAAASSTVGVLPCGIDRAYPAAHRGLLDAIATNGAVVSEYAPETTPARYRFLVRNRLIAALAEVTVVVEAGRRSGSLNTATTAQNLGRTVAALPGPVTSAMSIGCHDMLRNHTAEIVTEWTDVRSLIGPIHPDPDPHRPGTRPTDQLDLVTGAVFEALPARGTCSVDDIATEAMLSVPQVLAALSAVERAGLAERVDGRWARSVLPGSHTR